MIFESLTESATAGELILVDGGLCRYHLRADGQLTIREILVLPELRNHGIGSAMLKALCHAPGARCIVARCPADLPANGWYERRGFRCLGRGKARSGRDFLIWHLALPLP
jgi:GNAT superfamily N-acetyltransferase